MKYEDIQLKINGTSIPAPIDLSFSMEDSDVDSGRDIESDKMYRNRKRSDIIKIGITYEINDLSSVSNLLNLIQDEFFTVEFYDIKGNKRVVKEFYAGPKRFNYICIGEVFVKGLKFNIIER